MKIAIMQPYLFPYIGYFQLVHAADVFVFYDDVNYINKGWINRNRILLNGTDHMFTLPCKEASQNKLIKDIEVQDDAKSIGKLLATMQAAYKKAPFYNDVYPIVERVLKGGRGKKVSEVAEDSVRQVCLYLGLERTFRTSSETYDNRDLKKADRLIDICHLEGITDYVNPSGGQEIYTKDYYAEQGVNLSFLQSERVEYMQSGDSFVPWLSVIDVLMCNSVEDVKNNILPKYQLI